MGNSEVRWFRLAAVAEAISWTGLLIAMVFKYSMTHDALGVHIFGPIHGGLFLAYLVTAVRAWRDQRWSRPIGWVAVLASVPPLGSVVFERWATHTGRLAGSAQDSLHTPAT
ncbi:MAG: DUF3817 domain-containing protein [Actinomycetota bacterium]|nr:DUF3817 domain-containing protein [Actinomycetota bacterium]